MRQTKRIIIEGMDGAGKTTLVDYLMMHVPNLEMVRNDEGPNRDFDLWWNKEFDRPKDALIPLHDRFFYSELVYGPILRGHITANPILVQNGLWYLRSTALLIYCRPHTEVLKSGFEVKTQMEGVPGKFLELLQLYDKLMDAEKPFYTERLVHYVWTREDEYKRVENIVKSYIGDDGV